MRFIKVFFRVVFSLLCLILFNYTYTYSNPLLGINCDLITIQNFNELCNKDINAFVVGSENKLSANDELMIGWIYYNGLCSQEKNLELAAEWMQQSADKGNMCAQFNTGQYYYHGIGVPQNMENAAKYWELSALQGYPDAYEKTGLAYWHGIGVNQDIAKAIENYEKIANTDNYIANLSLAFIYSEGKYGIKKNGVKTKAYMEAAISILEEKSRQGDSEATRVLGELVRIFTDN